MKKLLKFSEQGFTVISLLLFSGGPLSVLLKGGDSPGDGREAPSSFLSIQIVFLLLYVVTAVLLSKRWKQILNLLVKEKYVALLVGLAVVSVLWSSSPSFTLRRSIALAGTTFFGLYFATRYRLRKQLHLLGWTFGIAIVLSFLFALFLPEYGIMGGSFHAGTWRGIYSHKNGLGRVMVLSASVFLLLATDAKNRFLLWCGLSLSLVLLVLSTSKGALASGIVVLATLALHWILRRRYAAAITSAIAAAMVSACLVIQVSANVYIPLIINSAVADLQNASSITSPLSAPPDTGASEVKPASGEEIAPLQKRPRRVTAENLTTLTGRTKLWPRVLDITKERPWLGYGYNGFWKVTEESRELQANVGEFAKNSHNGLLELWLDLGLVGVAIFICSFVSFLGRWVKNARAMQSPIALWPLTYSLSLVLINLTASDLLERNNIFWLLYVGVVFSGSFLQKQLE
ncbi:MAG: O-antigen ligase family protein [Cyanophyceae cyanobacterium]